MPWCRYSLAELLMGRRLRTQVPQLPEQFIPNWPHLESLKVQHERYKTNKRVTMMNITEHMGEQA